MITINLLSSEEKKDISYEKNNISLIGSFVILGFIIALLTFVIITIEDVQTGNLDALTSETKNIEKFLNQTGNQQIESKMRQINYYLSTIKTIKGDRTNFSKTIVEIANQTPNGIRLFDIKLNKTDKNFEISGNAGTRDELILFTSNLEKTGYFENIESPSSNLISPTNVSFKITGKLTDKALK
ncbi:MAG: PilN domain-containing protein [Patescibacteria group bacterium]|jgi:Tfp pilus assembly protein PilN